MNDSSGYSADQRGPVSQNSGLTSIYRPSQRGWENQTLHNDVNKSLDYWPSQRNSSLHESNGNLTHSSFESSQHTVISESTTDSTSQSSRYAPTSQRSLGSKNAWANLSISFSERDLLPAMIHPESVHLTRDEMAQGVSEQSNCSSA